MTSELALLRNRVIELEDIVRGLQAQVQASGALQKYSTWELASDTTLTQSDMGLTHYVNCSATAAITLPTATEGQHVEFINTGTFTIEIKDDTGTRITYLYGGYRTLIHSYGTEWPDAVTVYAKDGKEYHNGTIIIGDPNGIQIIESDGSDYRYLSIDNTGSVGVSAAGIADI